MKKFLCLILLLTMVSFNSYAGVWDKGVPNDDDNWIDYPTDAQANNDALDRLLSNYRSGMKLTYYSGAITTVSSGEIVVSNAAGTTRIFLNNTADVDITFSDLDTGSEEASKTYYVYAIAALSSSETATFKISASSTAPTGVTYYKRIGSFYNNASSNMEQIANDDERVVTATGTVSDGGTIAVPAGYTADECKWVSGIGTFSTTHAYGLQSIDFSCNSSRVCQTDIVTRNWVDGSTSYNNTGVGQYTITCHR
jgi:hypothetical protein